MSSNSSEPRRSYSQRAGMDGMYDVSPASTSLRNASVCGSGVASKAKPGELPARVRREEVAVRLPAVAPRSRAARALEHQLPAHELAVIFADCAIRRGEAGVGSESALSPFPDVTEHPVTRPRGNRTGRVQLVAEARIGRRGEAFPLCLRRQSRPGPAGECVRLIITDVCDGSGPVDVAAAAERELAVRPAPVKRSPDALAPDPVPA